MGEIDRPKGADYEDPDADLEPRRGHLLFVIVVGTIVGLVPPLFSAAAILFWALVIASAIGFVVLAWARWVLGVSVITWIWDGLRLRRR